MNIFKQIIQQTKNSNIDLSKIINDTENFKDYLGNNEYVSKAELVGLDYNPNIDKTLFKHKLTIQNIVNGEKRIITTDPKGKYGDVRGSHKTIFKTNEIVDGQSTDHDRKWNERMISDKNPNVSVNDYNTTFYGDESQYKSKIRGSRKATVYQDNSTSSVNDDAMDQEETGIPGVKIKDGVVDYEEALNPNYTGIPNVTMGDDGFTYFGNVTTDDTEKNVIRNASKYFEI